MLKILTILWWINVIIPIGILAFYLNRLIQSEGKCWEQASRSIKRNIRKNIIFVVWLIMTMFWTGCLHSREKDDIKQKQEEKIMVLEQQYQIDVFILQAKGDILCEEREKIVQILDNRHFLYFPQMRLKNIREVLE